MGLLNKIFEYPHDFAAIEQLAEKATQEELNEALWKVTRLRHQKLPETELPVMSSITKRVALLLEKKADPKCKIEGDTPLHWAAFLGLYDVCILLIQHGADPEAVNFLNQTPLDCYSDTKNQYRKDPSPETKALLTELSLYKKARAEYKKNEKNPKLAQASFDKLVNAATPKVLSALPGAAEEILRIYSPSSRMHHPYIAENPEQFEHWVTLWATRYINHPVTATDLFFTNQWIHRLDNLTSVAFGHGLQSKDDPYFLKVVGYLEQLRSGVMPTESKAAGDEKESKKAKESKETEQNTKPIPEEGRNVARFYLIFIQLMVFKDVTKAKAIAKEITSEPERAVITIIFELETYFEHKQKSETAITEFPIKPEDPTLLNNPLLMEYLNFKGAAQPQTAILTLKKHLVCASRNKVYSYFFPEEERPNLDKYFEAIKELPGNNKKFHAWMVNIVYDSNDEVFLSLACKTLSRFAPHTFYTDAVYFAKGYIEAQSNNFKLAEQNLQLAIDNTDNIDLKIKAMLALSKMWCGSHQQASLESYIKIYDTLKDSAYFISKPTLRSAVIQELEIILENIYKLNQPDICKNISKILFTLHLAQANSANNFADLERWILRGIAFINNYSSADPNKLIPYLFAYINAARKYQEPLTLHVVELLQNKNIRADVNILNALACYKMAVKPIEPVAAVQYYSEAIQTLTSQKAIDNKDLITNYTALIDLHKIYDFPLATKGFAHLLNGVDKSFNTVNFLKDLFNSQTKSIQKPKNDSKGDSKAESKETKEITESGSGTNVSKTKEGSEAFYLLLAPIEILRAQAEYLLAHPEIKATEDKSALACIKKAADICNQLLPLAEQLLPEKGIQLKKILNGHLVFIRQLKLDGNFDEAKETQLKEIKTQHAQAALESSENKASENAIRLFDEAFAAKKPEDRDKAIRMLAQSFDGLKTEAYALKIAKKLFSALQSQKDKKQFIYIILKLLAKCPNLWGGTESQKDSLPYWLKLMDNTPAAKTLVDAFVAWRITLNKEIAKDPDVLIVMFFIACPHKDYNLYKDQLLGTMSARLPASIRSEKMAGIQKTATQQLDNIQNQKSAGEEKTSTAAAATLGLSLSKGILNREAYAARIERTKAKADEKPRSLRIKNDNELTRALARKAKKEEIIEILNSAPTQLLNSYLHQVVNCRQGFSEVIEVECSHNPPNKDCTEHNIIEDTLYTEEEVIEYVTLLLKRGADINDKCEFKFGAITIETLTVLHTATALGMFRLCVFLLENGASISVTGVSFPVQETAPLLPYPEHGKIQQLFINVAAFQSLYHAVFVDGKSYLINNLLNTATDDMINIFPSYAFSIALLFCEDTNKDWQQFIFWLNKWINFGRYSYRAGELSTIVKFLREAAQFNSLKKSETTEIKETKEVTHSEEKNSQAITERADLKDNKTVALFTLLKIYLLVYKNPMAAQKLIQELHEGTQKTIAQDILKLDRVLNTNEQLSPAYIQQLSELTQQSSFLVDYLAAKANANKTSLAAETALHLLKQLSLLNNPYVLQLPLFANKKGLPQFIAAQKALEDNKVHLAITQLKEVIKQGENDIRVNACLAVSQIYRDSNAIAIDLAAAFNIMVLALKIPLDKFQRYAVINELQLILKACLATSPKLLAKIHVTLGKLLLAQAASTQNYPKFEEEVMQVLTHCEPEDEAKETQDRRMLRFEAACHFAKRAFENKQEIPTNIIAILENAANSKYLPSYSLLAQYYLTNVSEPDIAQATYYHRRAIEVCTKMRTNYSVANYIGLIELYKIHKLNPKFDDGAFVNLLAGTEAACKDAKFLELLWQNGIANLNDTSGEGDKAKVAIQVESKAERQNTSLAANNPFELLLTAVDIFIIQSDFLVAKSDVSSKNESEIYLLFALKMCNLLAKASEKLPLLHRAPLISALASRVAYINVLESSASYNQIMAEKASFDKLSIVKFLEFRKDFGAKTHLPDIVWIQLFASTYPGKYPLFISEQISSAIKNNVPMMSPSELREQIKILQITGPGIPEEPVSEQGASAQNKGGYYI